MRSVRIAGSTMDKWWMPEFATEIRLVFVSTATSPGLPPTGTTALRGSTTDPVPAWASVTYPTPVTGLTATPAGVPPTSLERTSSARADPGGTKVPAPAFTRANRVLRRSWRPRIGASARDQLTTRE
ncbi:hypothetical protein [Amycolatopsis sp. NPDC051128]|uniref:hypothetical protein n=1 Tax=Amycolatopsis sp. NPDC051128 TaxID=3155412 RepID=UPI003422BCA3